VICFLIAFAVGLAAASSAFADTNLRPGIIGGDNRKPILNDVAPWSAIGQINVSGYRSYSICTGTLVAPKIVISAAHCVFDPHRKRPYPSHNIHFVAGVNREKNLGHTTADCVIFPPDFNADAAIRVLPDLGIETLSTAFLKNDLALIVLKDDLPEAGHMQWQTTTAVAGTAIIQAGYHGDRRYILTGDSTCHIKDHIDNLVTTDCDVAGGGSGGPVIEMKDDRPNIVAVMAAVNPAKGTIAVPLTNWTGFNVDVRCP
jgi:protease YdgD